ncbi:MAG: SDR family oxidoreductase [Spirochaetales bacterium]|jgi:NAD(P)-dependent dehydrogenase (short-subunit alcohol dehydrogenase family)|nr:SDR family oxidoreductase [Spirochaetales bacterium]
MKNWFSLENKVVFITGGAGYLGSQMVNCLLDQGAIVTVGDIVDKKPEDYGFDTYSRLHCLYADIGSTDSIRKAFLKTEEIGGKIDILVNCGRIPLVGAYPKIDGPGQTVEDLNRGFDGYCASAYRCIREVVPFMEKIGGGSIVNISSMYGVVPPDLTIYGDSGQDNPLFYGVAKAGLVHLTKYAASNLGPKNIRVNTVSPGPFPNPEKLPPEDFLNNLNAKTLLGRVGVPHEIGGAVAFLASDAASFVTGINILVDGGWTVR